MSCPNKTPLQISLPTHNIPKKLREKSTPGEEIGREYVHMLGSEMVQSSRNSLA
jgi:hypothetical protein